MLNEFDERVVTIGYCDSWVGAPGRIRAAAGDEPIFESGSLPWAGEATVTVNRVGDWVTCKWNDEVILEALDETPVVKVEIRFYYTWYGNADTHIDESVDFFRITDSVAVAAPGEIPCGGPRLSKIHPNPFNPQTTITFTLGQPQHAEIAVYDLTGRLLDVLADRTYEAGNHPVVWSGKDAMGRTVPSGAYIVRLETESGVESRKVMLLR